MRPSDRLMRVAVDRFRAHPWHVHHFLADVPLHDVWQIHLEGGPPGLHLKDFRAAIEGRARPTAAVRLLVGLRRALGAVLRLDGRVEGAARDAAPPRESYVHRLTAEERARSLEPPGRRRGIFRVVYAFPDEALDEVVNRTVHAFSFMGMAPAPDGYRVDWAIYVRPVGRLTRPYMALIDPFRRRVVYPSTIRGFERAWTDAHRDRPASGA